LLFLVTFGVGALLLRSYFPAYFARKGENLATKEDIGQITREIEHVKTEFATQLKTLDQSFALGAASHMAEVTFDHHVQFCEEYANAFLERLPNLIGSGPSEKVEDISRELHKVRRKFELWITRDLATRLDKFEKAIFSMATDTILLRDLHGPERLPIIERKQNTWLQVTGFIQTEPDGVVDEEKDHRAVLQALQMVLGVDRLTELRRRTLERATEEVNATTSIHRRES